MRFSIPLWFSILLLLVSFQVAAETGAKKPYSKSKTTVEFSTDTTAMLIIDSQKAFIPGTDDFWIPIYYPGLPIPIENVDPDLQNKVDRIGQLAASANQTEMTTLITYEAYEFDGFLDYSPYIDSVATQLPESTESFFKGYFNATTEDDFRSRLQALKNSGIKQFIVSGIETDVCVLQTVLGLRKMGFDVYLASDATFSTEYYNRHTFKRMQQAGVYLSKTADLLESISGEETLMLSPRYALKKRYKLHQGDRHQMAALSFNLDNESLKLAEHDNKSAVWYRTRQWAVDQHYIYSAPETAEMPSYHISNANLPMTDDLLQGDYIQNLRHVKDAIKAMKKANKTQAIITGVVNKRLLLSSVKRLMRAGITPVIFEDALLGLDHDPVYYLDDAYNLGAVPSSAKSTGYEMYRVVQLRDFNDAEKAGYFAMEASGALVTIPELYPRIR